MDNNYIINKILVVEDSLTQAEELRYLLELKGYTVTIARTGKEALDVIASSAQDFIISDIIMPEMDGYELCKTIKSDKSFSSIPLILLTSLSSPENLLKGLESGADGFLSKPFSKNTLYDRIESISVNREFKTKGYSDLCFRDENYKIKADRQTLLNFLLSTYETALQKNDEFIKIQGQMFKLNDQLEKKVEERTAELKKSEARFRQLYEEFQTLLQAIPETLVLLSSNMKVLWSNTNTENTFDRLHSDTSGKTCCELLFGGLESCAECPAADSLREGKVTTLEFATRDGRNFDIKAFPVKNEDGALQNVMVMAEDITEKTTLQAEAMRASHLASIGELAAGVAHELNNPINGIINYAQMMINNVQKESKEHEISTRIIKEGDRISSIVSSLLTFSRTDNEKKVPVNVNEILSEALILSEAQLKQEGITVITDIPDVLSPVMANLQEIQQVFMNLISNARYALKQKYPDVASERILKIYGENVNNKETYVRIIFNDNGTGIPAALIDVITHPFYTTKSRGSGTGLGLSISCNIIKDHNGCLKIESKEGAYTNIIVELPAYVNDK